MKNLTVEIEYIANLVFKSIRARGYILKNDLEKRRILTKRVTDYIFFEKKIEFNIEVLKKHENEIIKLLSYEVVKETIN